MAEHTPGPWVVDERETCEWNSPQSPRREVYAVRRHNDFGGDVARYRLAQVSYPPTAVGTGGAEERAANARLIAAAPDLLEAARRAIDVTRFFTGDHVEIPRDAWAELIGALNDAVDAAEGSHS